jgi:hypothetical protein
MSSYREPTIRGDDEPTPVEDRALRPTRMADMVGQRDVYERLMIAVDAAHVQMAFQTVIVKFRIIIGRQNHGIPFAKHLINSVFEKIIVRVHVVSN